MTTLREAAQQALEALKNNAGEMRVEGAISILETALAQQAEPQGCETEEDCTRQPWCRIRGECQRKQDEPRNQCGETCERAKLCATYAQALAQQDEPDLSRCPQCNGPADNGFDRSIPPSPYLCTKCMAEPVTEDMKSAVRWAPSSAYWSQRLRELFGPDAREGIDALERRLAEAQQAEPVEPVDVGLLEYRGNSVAFIHQKMTAYRAGIDAAWDALRAKGLHPDGKTSLANMIAKYTAPPQRRPLTEEEIDAEWRELDGEVSTMFMRVLRKFARAVERAVWEKNNG